MKYTHNVKLFKQSIIVLTQVNNHSMMSTFLAAQILLLTQQHPGTDVTIWHLKACYIFTIATSLQYEYTHLKKEGYGCITVNQVHIMISKTPVWSKYCKMTNAIFQDQYANQKCYRLFLIFHQFHDFIQTYFNFSEISKFSRPESPCHASTLNQ